VAQSIAIVVFYVSIVTSCSTILNWLLKRNFQMQLLFAVLTSGARRIPFSTITEVGVCVMQINFFV